MAKAATIKIKLLSTADTGFFYVTKKNTRTMTDKLSKKKVRPRGEEARRRSRKPRSSDRLIGFPEKTVSGRRWRPFSCVSLHKLFFTHVAAAAGLRGAGRVFSSRSMMRYSASMISESGCFGGTRRPRPKPRRDGCGR